MVSLVKSWLKGTDKIAGLSVKINNDLTKEYRLLVIKNSNGKITVENTQTTGNLEELKANLNADTPVILCITGKGIINKFVPGSQQDKNLFPGMDANEIVTQKYLTPTGYFLSLIRQETLKSILSDIRSAGFYTISVSLGSYITHHFLKITNSITQSNIAFDGNLLIVDENKELVECYSDKVNADSQQEFMIANENIKSEYLNAYTVVNSYLFFEEARIAYCTIEDSEITNEQKHLYKDKVLWKRKGLAVLAIVLVVLIANFILFSNLSKANNINRTKLGIYQDKLKKLDSLEKYVSEKKILLSDVGLADNFSVSQLCDALAASVPSDVQLKELAINPVDDQASRKEKELVYQQKKVSIKGITKNMSSLNQWLKTIEAKTGIKNLKMEEYHYDQSASAGFFVLEGNI
ncbi:MAG: hypothetical protein ACTHJT_04300 [Cytophaga sp.]|uniref:hypothetical protein n=1 Tax=Cytophaga sp. TaxID=29535 RepID=UPI003F7D2551